MDKNTIIAVIGVAAVGALGFYAYKNRDTLFAAPQTVAQDMGGSDAGTSLPSFSAQTTSYSPIPIGAVNAGQRDMSPPGVNPAGLEVQKPSQLHDDSKDKAPEEEDGGTSQELLKSNGAASLPVPANQPQVGNAAIIDQRYMELFGRHADEAGMQFWQGALAKGTTTVDTLTRDLTIGAAVPDLLAEADLAPEAVINYRRT